MVEQTLLEADINSSEYAFAVNTHTPEDSIDQSESQAQTGREDRWEKKGKH